MFKPKQKVKLLTLDNVIYKEDAGVELKKWVKECFLSDVDFFIHYIGDQNEKNCTAVLQIGDTFQYITVRLEDIKVKELVYICGPISRIKNGNKEAFEFWENYFIELGYDVINPHKLNQENCVNHEDFMKIDLPELMKCNLVAVLNGEFKFEDWGLRPTDEKNSLNFTESKGCIMEIFNALMLKIEVIGISKSVEEGEVYIDKFLSIKGSLFLETELAELDLKINSNI